MLSPQSKRQRKSKKPKFSSPQIEISKKYLSTNESTKENKFTMNSRKSIKKKTRTSSKFKKQDKFSSSFFKEIKNIKIKTRTPNSKMFSPLKKYEGLLLSLSSKNLKKKQKKFNILKNGKSKKILKEIKSCSNSPKINKFSKIDFITQKKSCKNLQVKLFLKKKLKKKRSQKILKKKENNRPLQNLKLKINRSPKKLGKAKSNKNLKKLLEKKNHKNSNKNFDKKNMDKFINRNKTPKIFEILTLFNKHTVKYLNMNFLLSHLSHLLTLYCSLENEEESFYIIKEYTDYIQNDSFLILESLMENKSKTKECLMSLKLEVVSIFVIFYNLIDGKNGELKDFLKLIELLAKNYYIFLTLLKKLLNVCNKKKEVRMMKEFFKNSNCINVFTIQGSLFNNLKRNNNLIKSILTKILKKKKMSIRTKIDTIIKKLNNLSLNEGIGKIFEFFNKIFEKQKINLFSQSQIQPESGPAFIIQPFDTNKLLPSKTVLKNYTLVLDLDETLIHFSESKKGGEFFLRPYSKEFLIEMSKYYEIVIFTAALKDYADWIIDRIDLEKKISHRLYRRNTTKQNGVYLKDLSKIGRKLNKSLIVDNNPENFMLQPENGIYIKSWYNDPEDRALEELALVLKNISLKEYGDIRDGLREYRIKFSQKTLNTHN